IALELSGLFRLPFPELLRLIVVLERSSKPHDVLPYFFIVHAIKFLRFSNGRRARAAVRPRESRKAVASDQSWSPERHSRATLEGGEWEDHHQRSNGITKRVLLCA